MHMLYCHWIVQTLIYLIIKLTVISYILQYRAAGCHHSTSSPIRSIRVTMNMDPYFRYVGMGRVGRRFFTDHVYNKPDTQIIVYIIYYVHVFSV